MTDLGRVFPMFKLICYDSKDQSLNLRYGFRFRFPVGHRTRQRRYLGYPTPIVFALNFNSHGNTLPYDSQAGKCFFAQRACVQLNGQRARSNRHHLRS